jgi:DNA-binding XRE family transcriptional regulator
MKLACNEVVKTYRDRKGMTQQELADKLGISLKTLWNIENKAEAARSQSLSIWESLCSILGIPKEEVF